MELKRILGMIGCCAIFFCAASANGQNIDTCKRWLGWIGINTTTQAEARMKYDTLHHYIESCGKNDDSYHAFSGLDDAVELMSNDPTRYVAYRAWLISILYLNTTSPYYFCACMESIAGTYGYGKYPLAGLAILKYLDTNGCTSKGLRDQIVSDSSIDFHEGYDPTQLPSLKDLGLDSILKLRNGVPPQYTPLPSSSLTDFAIAPNPSRNIVTASYVLGRQSYIQLSVLDALGKTVWQNPGTSEISGQHEISLDLSRQPSGTYYLRIQTGFGEVKTVKLVHEQ